MDTIKILDVTASNVAEAGICCIKNKKAPGYHAKIDWFKSENNTGLKILLAQDENGRSTGFIEYIPSENAWRPVKAENYIFIQCIAVYNKELRHSGIGGLLIKECIKDAVAQKKSGICTMVSEGPWMSGKKLFELNGFKISSKKDRYELMVLKLNALPDPEFYNWENNLKKYVGWHLLYADQCPWHQKSVIDITRTASESGISINVRKLASPSEAQNSPSGFGTFALIKDGKVLADHYISETRFRNILKEISY